MASKGYLHLLVFVVARSHEVEWHAAPRMTHFVVVVGAEVVVLAGHQSMRRVRRAVRTADDRHFLDALAHARAPYTAENGKERSKDATVGGVGCAKGCKNRVCWLPVSQIALLCVDDTYNSI